MTTLAGSFLSKDLELGLMIMFSYDYMYLTHICICEYLDPHPPLENPPLEKVEPKYESRRLGRDFVEPNTSPVGLGRDFVEPKYESRRLGRDFMEPNIKKLIRLINS